jgi:hypothetical protein
MLKRSIEMRLVSPTFFWWYPYLNHLL